MHVINTQSNDNFNATLNSKVPNPLPRRPALDTEPGDLERTVGSLRQSATLFK